MGVGKLCDLSGACDGLATLPDAAIGIGDGGLGDPDLAGDWDVV